MMRRSEIHWMTEVGMFFEKTGPVWDTLRQLQKRFDEAKIDYVVIGGLALNAHHYARQTIDIDVVLTEEDCRRFEERFGVDIYSRVPGAARRYADPDSGVTIDLLVAGQLAGLKSKNRSVHFPSPSEAEMHNDLRTVSLWRLIELKLVTWRYKDWGDVVELIRANRLEESFAENVDSCVRSAFQQCWDQANDPEYDGS